MTQLKARIKKIEKEVMKDITLDTYLDGLELAYKKGFIDAINDFGDKDTKKGMFKEDMEKILSNAVKKTRKDFYKELLD